MVILLASMYFFSKIGRSLRWVVFLSYFCDGNNKIDGICNVVNFAIWGHFILPFETVLLNRCSTFCQVTERLNHMFKTIFWQYLYLCISETIYKQTFWQFVTDSLSKVLAVAYLFDILSGLIWPLARSNVCQQFPPVPSDILWIVINLNETNLIAPNYHLLKLSKSLK